MDKKIKRMSKAERNWVSNKIEYLYTHEGKTQKQAAGEAYGMLRQKRKKGGKAKWKKKHST